MNQLTCTCNTSPNGICPLHGFTQGCGGLINPIPYNPPLQPTPDCCACCCKCRCHKTQITFSK